MSLYIRLQTNFWSNRKTIRLRSLIGDAALWLPQRLWCYAAENQPDGDFSNYTAPELAMLLGYSGDAQAMLQALQQACFLSGMRIHAWEEHNAYHETFAQRSKKAAQARWKGHEKKGKERKGASITQAMLQAFAEFWKIYPRKIGKGNAEKAWVKMKCNNLLSSIILAIEAAKKSDDWTKDGGQFIPHPATWLNRRGWEDDYQISVGEQQPKHVRAKL